MEQFDTEFTKQHHQMAEYMDLFHERTGYVPVRFEESINKFQVSGLNARTIESLVRSHLSKEIFGYGRSDFKNYVEIDLRPLDGLGQLHRYCFDVNDKPVTYYD